MILRNARVAGQDALVDVLIAGGAIAAINPAAGSHEEIDAGGRVLIPGLVEAHLHLDKALLNERAPNRSGTLAEAIRVTQQAKRTFSPEDVRSRMEAALRMALRYGTIAIRAETEFDPQVGLLGIRTALELKRRYAALVDVQVVAFPQDGVHQLPGAEELFRRAMEMGADVVGGIPYNDVSAEKHVDLCFEIARAYDKPISFHIDFADEPDFLAAEYVARKTIAAGWQGRVTLGHATALGSLPPHKLEPILELLAQARISVVVLPLTDMHLGGRSDSYKVRRGLAPIRAMWEAGINVAASTNNLRNAFTPFGNGDPLQVAFLLLSAAHLGGSDTQPRPIDLLTRNAAEAIGLTARYGLEVGKSADLVLLDTTSAADPAGDLPERLLVMKHGQVVVRNTVHTSFELNPA